MSGILCALLTIANYVMWHYLAGADSGLSLAIALGSAIADIERRR